MAEVTIEQAFQIAVQHHQKGELAQAENIYRQILARQANHVGALHFLGVIAHQAGQHEIAVELITQALVLQPNSAEANSNLGKALLAAGRVEESIAACQRAIALRPEYVKAYINLGNAMYANGQLEEAIAACRQAISLNPDIPEAHNNLGSALKEMGELEQAITACRLAIKLNPQYTEAWNNLGSALHARGELDEAIAAYRQAISLNPGISQISNNLGNALQDQGNFDQAIAAFQQAISLNPDFSEAYGNMGNAFKGGGELDQAIAAYRRAVALKPTYHQAHSNLLYTIHLHSAYDGRAIAEEHRLWNQQHAEPLRKLIRRHANDRSPNRRIRIGYVSPDFRQAPVGRFLLPLLENRDKAQFELFAYADVIAPDAITERLRSHFDGWRNISGISDDKAADQIQADQIDILVDLVMHSARNRLLIFARKPAPIQVTYLAYCSGTGMDAMDYRLSDPYLDPPGEDESIYTEKTVRLPETYWCYQPYMDVAQSRSVPVQERGYITFGSLNNFCKVSEPALLTWARLLLTTPKSRLLLHAHQGAHRQRILDRLEREGIESARVEFTSGGPAREYFELYNRIDIALDPFPYGGGTTTCDALWMGVPVVSLVGSTAVGRGGLSILSNIGLPELAARSQDEYVRIAGELAGDLPRLKNLRSTLRQRMKDSPLMDGPRFARSVENAYRQMWRTWCGQAASHSENVKAK